MAAEQTPLTLHVVCQDRTAPLLITLPSPLATLAEIRRLIVSSMPEARGKVVRLLASGRLLANDGATARELGLRDESYVHVALSDPPTAPAVAAGATAPPIGGPSTAPSLSSASHQGAANEFFEAGFGARGFDRLRLLGLDDDDISALRHTFLPEVLAGTLPRLERRAGESEAQRLLRAEEVWMRAQGENTDFAANLRPMLMARRGAWPGAGAGPGGLPAGIGGGGGGGGGAGGDEHVPPPPQAEEGTTSSFVFGFIMGWALGIIMLLFSIHPQASRRFKLGVMLGVAVNVLAAVGWTLLEPDDSSGSGGSASGSGSGSGAGSLTPIVQDAGSWTGSNTGIKPVDLPGLG
jgi:hypothetical protein